MCIRDRLYVVEVGEVTDASESAGAITLAASAARLRETFELVGLDNDRLRRAVEERSTGA